MARTACRLELGGKRRTVSAPPGAGQLSCGPVRVRLHAFDLETEAIARIGPRHEVRAWLREWSGVSVYRDGFRIWPYGEPHDDWLRLDQRRVNNPSVCLNNNQVVGFVEISRDRNPDLADQTNREGLVNNEALQDLRRIIEHAFQLLESERQRQRRPNGVSRTRGARTRIELPVADALERLSTLTDGRTRGELRRIVQEARDSAEQQHLHLHRLIQGYADLAAAGEAAIGIGGALTTLVGRTPVQRCERRKPGASKTSSAKLRDTLATRTPTYRCSRLSRRLVATSDERWTSSPKWRPSGP